MSWAEDWSQLRAENMDRQWAVLRFLRELNETLGPAAMCVLDHDDCTAAVEYVTVDCRGPRDLICRAAAARFQIPVGVCAHCGHSSIICWKVRKA